MFYHYAGNNPVRYTDPDGKSTSGKILGYGCYVLAGVCIIAGAAVSVTTGQVYITAGAVNVAKFLVVSGTAVLAVDAASDFAKSGKKTSSANWSSSNDGAASSPSPLPPDPDDEKQTSEKTEKKTSVNQMNREIKTGKAPKDIKRIDKADTNVKGSQNHVHFKDGTSLNQDGTVHDAHCGDPSPSKDAIKWLTNNGWNIE